MRLLHVLDIINDDHDNPVDIEFEFKEFFIGQYMPKEAILSHTSEPEEVSFQELVDILSYEHPDSFFARVKSSRIKGLKRKDGYQKIVRFCNQLWQDGLDYGWADTCRIDKTSSAELSEAINSMYQWYECSQVCIAYLTDVQGSYSFPEGRERSRWFTRGWTLQELIAPRKVLFHDSHWNLLFDKTSESDRLSIHTGISRKILTGMLPPTKASIAERMSWACQCETSRLEDMAYCLLGIFQVNTPLIYGEGKRALIHLQEAIMQDSSDHSLFAWSDRDPSNTDNVIQLGFDRLSGLLASSPFQFAHAWNTSPHHHEVQAHYKVQAVEYWMTNEGLRIESPGYQIEQSELLLGVLDCAHLNHGVAVFRRMPLFRSRIVSSQQLFAATRLIIYVKKQPFIGLGHRINSRHGLHFTSEPHKDSGVQLAALYPLKSWEPEDDLIKGPIKVAILGFSISSSTAVAVLIRTRRDADIPGFENTHICCKCQHLAGRSTSRITEHDLERFANDGRPATTTTFVDIDSRRRFIATVGKTKLLGEDVFALDVIVAQSDSMLFELPTDFSNHDHAHIETSSPSSTSPSKGQKGENNDRPTVTCSNSEMELEGQQRKQLHSNDARPAQISEIRLIDFSSVAEETEAHDWRSFL